MKKEDLSRLPRWHIKEPNHREFEVFKKEFLLGKAQSTREKELLRYIGELQSEVEVLKHALETCQEMTPKEYEKFIKRMLQEEQMMRGPGNKAKMQKEIDRMRAVLIANNLTW